MNKCKRPPKWPGIPTAVPTRLRIALAQELQRLGGTYNEIAHAGSLTLTPTQVLWLARAWNGLSAAQKAAWVGWVGQEHLRGDCASCRG